MEEDQKVINYWAYIIFLIILLIGVGIILGINRILNSGTSSNASPSTSFNVYFRNDLMNKNPNDCSVNFPVKRTAVSSTMSVEIDALDQLFQGPTQSEVNKGYYSIFSKSTQYIVRDIKIQNSVAYVNFNNIQTEVGNITSTCGSTDFMSEIQKTLFQLDHINKVIYAINGDTKSFYMLVGIGCGAINNNCDNSAFE